MAKYRKRILGIGLLVWAVLLVVSYFIFLVPPVLADEGICSSGNCHCHCTGDVCSCYSGYGSCSCTCGGENGTWQYCIKEN